MSDADDHFQNDYIKIRNGLYLLEGSGLHIYMLGILINHFLYHKESEVFRVEGHVYCTFNTFYTKMGCNKSTLSRFVSWGAEKGYFSVTKAAGDRKNYYKPDMEYINSEIAKALEKLKNME